MKKRRTLTILTAVFITLSGVLLSQQKTLRIAVAPFTPLTVEAERENLSENAATLIENGINELNRFELRKRGDIKNFIDKLTLAQLGLGNVDELKGMARNLKLDYVTVGTVSVIDGRHEMDVRTVNVNDWTIVHSSGCTSFDIDSASRFIRGDMRITFTPESIVEIEKDDPDRAALSVYSFDEANIMAQGSGYGGVFAEMISGELGALRELTVIERTQARAMLNEKTLEMAGVIENDASDSYFNVRGISYKLAGSFRIFRDVICINYQIINTAKGSPVYTGYTEIASPEALRPAARHIAKNVEDALNNRIGSLKLVTAPREADITIDGQPAGKSPLNISIARGAHKIKAVLRGYETTEKDISIEPRKLNTVDIRLEPVSTKLLAEALSLEQNNNCQAALDKYQEFIDRYGEAEEVNQAYYRKGHILQNCLNRNDEAIAAFQALISRYPDAMTRAEAYFGVARTYKAMGNKKQAKETLTILIEKYPDSYAAEEGRALLGQL